MKRFISYFTLLALLFYGKLVLSQDQLIPMEKTDFRDSVFTGFADFWDTEFNFAVSFLEAEFQQDAELNNAVFNLSVDLTMVKFKNVDFQKARFRSGVSFQKTIFDSIANFSQVEFDSLVDFSYTQVWDQAKFYETRFAGPVDFVNMSFENRVEFSETEFSEDVDFTNAIFDSLAIFHKVEFGGDVDFSNAILPNELDFSYTTKISGEIDLTLATLNKKYDICYINLVGASVENFRFRYNRFRLWFPPEDTTIDFELKSNVYEALLQKQQEEGFTQSYEKLDKEYREFKYTGQGGTGLQRTWGHFSNWIDKNWWGYGYNKELIVINTLILYLLFAFLNTFMLKHLTINVYEAEKINEFWNEARGSGIGMFFRAIPFSLFYTAQIFFGFRFDMDKLKYKENLQGWKIFNLVYFITVYLSGLVCFAYLANYVVTV